MSTSSALPSDISSPLSCSNDITISSVPAHSDYTDAVQEAQSPKLAFQPKDDAIDHQSDTERSVLCDPHIHDSTPLECAQIVGMDAKSSSAESEPTSVSTKLVKTPFISKEKVSVPSSAPSEIAKRVCTVFSPQISKTAHDCSDEIDKSRVVVQVLTSQQQAEDPSDDEQVIESKPQSPQASSLCSFRDDLFSILGKSKPSDSKPSHDSFKRSYPSGDDSGISSLNDKVCLSGYGSSSKQMEGAKQDSLFRSFSNFKSKQKRYGRHQGFTRTKNRKYFDRSVPAKFYQYRLNKKTGPISKRGVKVPLSAKKKTPSYKVPVQIYKENFKVEPEKGSGKMLGEINTIASNIDNASSSLLRILHYVLFDSYGPCNSNIQLSQTKENILFFTGFTFGSNTLTFQKKKNCLMRLPFPILLEMYEVIIGQVNKNREEIVDQLMEFFMKPSDGMDCDMVLQSLSSEEYEYLKKIALTESPKVLLQNLTIDEIDDLKEKVKTNVSETHYLAEALDSEYYPPPYVLKGPGKKLKHFPNIAEQVQRAGTSIIESLHYLLYGRCESKDVSQMNILEFSGFLPCQGEFKSQRVILLKDMTSLELFHICKVLCLRASTNSKNIKIQKIMRFLSRPSVPRNGFVFQRVQKRIFPTPSLQPSLKKDKMACEVPKRVTGPKLGDFKQIRYNIECASPSDLTELNDLLFIKPCDESEIHQKILDFTQFDFSVSSIEYHYRKTLMHYMSFCTIKKIAQLLAIEKWESSSSQSDLSSHILNFLVDMKNSGTAAQKNLSVNLSKSSYHSSVSGDKSNLSLLEVYEKKTEKSWSFQNPLELHNNQNSPSDMKFAVNGSVQKQTYAKIEKHVLIHRLTKSGEEKRRIDVHIPLKSIQNEDDSTPLRALLHHPSDQELKEVINKIIKSDLFNITLGKLVQKVNDFYPDLNISYREDFIKTQARLILSQLRSNAVDTLNSLQCNLSDVI